MKTQKLFGLYKKIRGIIESARAGAARSVNTAQVVSNWLIGREIVEEEQAGKTKAEYGARLLVELSSRLRREYGNGYSVDNLELFRRFCLEYPGLISEALLRKSSASAISDAVRRKLLPAGFGEAFSVERNKVWKPGLLNPNLSWTHYRTLLRVGKADVRAFYEIEAIKNNWAARELERQINKLTHSDLGQMLMYVNYYNREISGPADNPTIGLMLCTDKNDAVVKYVLDEKKKRIFASRYKTCLPSEKRLRAELRRELGSLPPLDS